MSKLNSYYSQNASNQISQSLCQRQKTEKIAVANLIFVPKMHKLKMKLLQRTMLTLGMSALMGVANAQSDTASVKKVESSIKIEPAQKVPIRKFYFGNELDGVIFSTALIDRAGSNSLGTLRFTGFFHVGATYNYNFSKHQGIYTGIDIKNIGFIEKFSLFDVTVKRRNYTVGVPLGFRLGNLTKKNYFFLGGGLDIAFHYKVKSWTNNQSKTKYNDWFSNETQILQPYIFAGIAVKGTTFKIQYYTNNFLNQNFTAYDVNGQLIKPYAATKVNLLLLSIGRDINFSKK